MASMYADTVVCYFSCTGNTRALAETASKVLNADLFEIVPEEQYTDADIDWHDSNSRSSIECNDSKSRPAIKTLKPVQGDNKAFDVSKYDTVVLAFPIWWNSAPKIMWNFVEQNDLSGKTVVVICTSGSSSISGAEKDLKARASKSAIWKRGSRFTATTSESELKKYFDTVLK
ncbi:MAG: NAD(P)H-dependent oxidoreductase [Treponemataceae bacterium]|nr:NAD(P)H-dependent oxidoreductase [Treponemataceae bacterium]